MERRSDYYAEYAPPFEKRLKLLSVTEFNRESLMEFVGVQEVHELDLVLRWLRLQLLNRPEGGGAREAELLMCRFLFDKTSKQLSTIHGISTVRVNELINQAGSRILIALKDSFVIQSLYNEINSTEINPFLGKGSYIRTDYLHSRIFISTSEGNEHDFEVNPRIGEGEITFTSQSILQVINGLEEGVHPLQIEIDTGIALQHMKEMLAILVEVQTRTL